MGRSIPCLGRTRVSCEICSTHVFSFRIPFRFKKNRPCEASGIWCPAIAQNRSQIFRTTQMAGKPEDARVVRYTAVKFYSTISTSCPLFPSLRALEQVYKSIALHLYAFIRTFDLHFLPINQVPFLFFNRHQTSFKLIRANENSERYFVFFSSCELSQKFRFRFCKEIGLQKQRSERKKTVGLLDS